MNARAVAVATRQRGENETMTGERAGRGYGGPGWWHDGGWRETGGAGGRGATAVATCPKPRFLEILLEIWVRKRRGNSRNLGAKKNWFIERF